MTIASFLKSILASKKVVEFFIKGRNGAGKSTLVKTLIALSENRQPTANLIDGEIKFGNDIRIGEYQQEIDEKYLSQPLAEAVRIIHQEKTLLLMSRKSTDCSPSISSIPSWIRIKNRQSFRRSESSVSVNQNVYRWTKFVNSGWAN